MTLTIAMLNFLHKKRMYSLLCFICRFAYRLKGFGDVPVSYHPEFRGYAFKVRGVVYLSLGPGWAFHAEYLSNVLRETYGYEYMPQPGDCVVDIGSGLGEEVVAYAGLVGEAGSVHALEANPITFKGLNYLCKENHFTQVLPHHLAIYYEDGQVTIEDDEENYLTNTINASHSEGFAVEAVTLDTFVAQFNLKKINFLKANIEGAEQFLIQGMNHSVSILENVCISCHDFRHRFHQHGEFYLTREKVIAFLKSNGFEVTYRNTGNRVVDDYIYGRKSTVR